MTPRKSKKKDIGNWVRDREQFYPEAIILIARERCAGLSYHISTEPVTKLIEAAYMQGLVDGVLVPAQSHQGEEDMGILG